MKFPTTCKITHITALTRNSLCAQAYFAFCVCRIYICMYAVLFVCTPIYMYRIVHVSLHVPICSKYIPLMYVPLYPCMYVTCTYYCIIHVSLHVPIVHIYVCTPISLYVCNMYLCQHPPYAGCNLLPHKASLSPLHLQVQSVIAWTC